ncbi:bifunctional 4-hydroxy-2-oxoglutarate aldolase/2-dehydro-3-deoxy-phosphogluconate aldolase [Bacillus horti]|uniref:2-dehydro-3-deoxyphosphogluconate aldolase/(4S)-4-hydroxy-2-oxoglutarate aldolase n=1 Tax=Caldalkalibacillus horti TaxID=77523 RepID=A0ABT9VVF5_9BACI|nr:bifunctional 4-hydroxy-2-oxoglutarate aldolase/2-dehydro-3-deoxy-phosphogluconate aldolase [Bacillus horti]MDQ0164979.1 2-dehydro-3-deoxyphosphogluconate aldolase/(4S)-4-hydroxy-2-oxoglutarate aldolase [Bacillus horti]
MHNKASDLQMLTESGVIAVIRRVPIESIERLADSLVQGGVTGLEVTVDTPGAFEAITKLRQKLEGKAIVGAGTVLDSESAVRAIQSGAQFIFSPSVHQSVIRATLRYGRIAVPGVFTPTELVQALEWGADMVKLFPASNLGPGFVKDLKAPFPHVGIVPTGGVNLENVSAYFEAGASAVGVGSNLVHAKAKTDEDFNKVQEIAVQYVAKIKQAREQRVKSRL